MAISTFYNPQRLLSLNATYNFCVGPRGNGKTYGFKRKAIKDALRRGREFIYVRRWLPELKASAPSFFADIAHEFPDYDFRVRGKYAEASPVLKDGESEKGRKWKIIGYFVALSVASSFKSVSFAGVYNVIFDEFIAPEGKFPKYIQNEFKAWNEFYSTIDRYHARARVFFISNSVSIMNPYFIALEVRPDQMEKLTALFRNPDTGKPFVGIELIHNEAFNTEVFQTDFGRFIQQTDPEYAAYAVENDFADGHEQLVGDKSSDAEYMYTIETLRHGRFSVWHDFKRRQFFIRTKLPKIERIFTMDRNRMDEGKTFVTYADPPLARLRNAYNTARIIFDKPATRNAFAEIMDKR